MNNNYLHFYRPIRYIQTS